MSTPNTLPARPPTRPSVSIALGVLLSLGCASFGACFDGSDEAPSMRTADYDELAAALGTMLGADRQGQSGAFSGAAALARGDVPVGFELEGEVAFGERHGFDYSLAAICSDALGRGVTCDEGAAIAHIDASWNGEGSSEQPELTCEFDADWTMVALDRPTIVLAGRARARIDFAAQDDAKPARIEYRASYDDVGIDAVTGRARSGQVDYEVVLQRSGDASTDFVTVDGHLGFAADGTAVLTLDGDQRYRVELDGSVTRR